MDNTMSMTEPGAASSAVRAVAESILQELRAAGILGLERGPQTGTAIGTVVRALTSANTWQRLRDAVLDQECWVLVVSTRQGSLAWLAASQREANERLVEYVTRWWNDEMGDEPMPDDTEHRVTRYFERVDKEGAEIINVSSSVRSGLQAQNARGPWPLVPSGVQSPPSSGTPCGVEAGGVDNRCPYCGAPLGEPVLDWDDEGFSRATWTCPACSAKDVHVRYPPSADQAEGPPASEVAICQNCRTGWLVPALNPIRDITERVAEGEPTPAGECPDCGALCRLLEYRQDEPVLVEFRRGYLVPRSNRDAAVSAILSDIHTLDSNGELEAQIEIVPAAPGATLDDVNDWLRDEPDEADELCECSGGCGRVLPRGSMHSTHCGSCCRQCLPGHLSRCEICRNEMLETT